MMIEAEMLDILKPWLEDQDFKVWTEVNVPGWEDKRIDVVAADGGRLVAIELKKCLSERVIEQVVQNRLFMSYSFACVHHMPNPKWRVALKETGIGLLTLEPDGTVCERWPAFDRGVSMPAIERSLRARLKKRCPTCGQTDLKAFGKNKRNIDGLAVYCKKCRSEYGKKRYRGEWV